MDDSAPTPSFADLLAWSMDAEPALLPYLAELFGDLEELGVRAADVLAILADTGLPSEARVLDLGCGKGAIGIALVETYDCTLHGIDGLDAFVDHAEARAEERGLADRCLFAQADVRTAVQQSRDYDLVCMLALGDLLGTADETVATLRECVKPGGLMLVDDAYVREGATLPDDVVNCFDRQGTLDLLQALGDEVVAERIVDGPESAGDYAAMIEQIAGRAEDLAHEHPEDAELLRGYAERQREEAAVLDGPLVGALWLLRRSADG